MPNNGRDGRGSVLRVCHLASGDLWAGAEVQVATLLRALKRFPDLELSTLLFNRGRLADELSRMGIPVTVYEEARLGTARLLLAVRDHLKEIRPDILHSHRYKEHILGAIAGKLSNDPLTVQTYHGLEESLGGWAGLKMKAYNGINLVVGRATADGIVGVSSDITHVLERRYPSAHVRCIRNGIDLARTLATEGRSAVRARLGLAPETFVVGTVGRLTPIKGFEHLIEAFAQLRQQARVQDSRLVIVGDGPSRAILEQLAESHRVPAYVKFLGTRTDVYNLISAFDVFALSSLHEGVPMVLLEAMALQVPIVASRVGGIPEILEDGVEAALVPPKDPEALAKAIAVLAQSPELRAQRVRAARSRVEAEFSIGGAAIEMRELYRSLRATRNG